MKCLLSKISLATVVALSLTACTPDIDALIKASTRDCGGAGVPASSPVPVYTYKVLNSWPHSSWAFTEGIIFHKGAILESSGFAGASSLSQVVPGSGQVLKEYTIPEPYFAEGITIFQGRLYQLTLSDTGIIYTPDSLQKIGEFSYEGTGWGLTHDDRYLIMSDGTEVIRFVDPMTFKTARTINVIFDTIPVKNLNALAYVKGEIFANVWKTDYIARIDPQDGRITGWINLKGLLSPEEQVGDHDVLNGIAYDEQNDRLVVTGKRWPRFFEISLRRYQLPGD